MRAAVSVVDGCLDSHPSNKNLSSSGNNLKDYWSDPTAIPAIPQSRAVHKKTPLDFGSDFCFLQSFVFLHSKSTPWSDKMRAFSSVW